MNYITHLSKLIVLILVFIITGVCVHAQNVPEILYYKFKYNSGNTTPNFAFPGQGSSNATRVGMAYSTGGQFDTCLTGTGGAGSNAYLNTGWATNFGSAHWTISFWVNNLNEVVPTYPVYIFGDSTAGGFRCFYGGSATPGNIMLRGPFSDVLITNVMPGPMVIHIVYDGSNIIVYKNGVLFSTFPRTISLSGNGPFKVGAYSSTSYSLNGKLDEFRVYNRALTADEIAATWNVELPVDPPTCNYLWSQQVSGTIQQLNCIKTISESVGWAVGNSGTVRRTIDGGLNWTDGNPNHGVILGDINVIEAYDASTALCSSTYSGSTYVYYTINSGNNWMQVFAQPNGSINSIRFSNSNNAVMCGNPVAGRWSLWKTGNGGYIWDSIGMYLPQNGSETGLRNSFEVVGQNIWMGTNNNRVYHSTNYGSNWTYGTPTGLTNSYGVAFTNPALGLVGGTAMMRSTNGGVSYNAITVPGTGTITDIDAANARFWYTRGNNIYMSTDNGTSWNTAYTGNSNALLDINISIPSGCPQGWSAGANGTIVKMTLLVGISNNNNQIPTSFNLFQNYPNPFNPSTKIIYELPVPTNVKITVYDLLGREISLLVDAYQTAGSHPINFNGDGFASGIYLYKIEAGAFTDTKKMILLK